jgi:hypothetical protein
MLIATVGRNCIDEFETIIQETNLTEELDQLDDLVAAPPASTSVWRASSFGRRTGCCEASYRLTSQAARGGVVARDA